MLTIETMIEQAKSSKDYKEFWWKMHDLTEPYKSITEGKVGEFVRIKSKTYGDKTGYEYNLSIPPCGEILKFNRKTVRINTFDKYKKFYLYPMDSLISDDCRVSIMTYEQAEEFYNNHKNLMEVI